MARGRPRTARPVHDVDVARYSRGVRSVDFARDFNWLTVRRPGENSLFTVSGWSRDLFAIQGRKSSITQLEFVNEPLALLFSNGQAALRQGK